MIITDSDQSNKTMTALPTLAVLQKRRKNRTKEGDKEEEKKMRRRTKEKIRK